MKQFSGCQPRPAKSVSASLIPALIFSAVMLGGNAGSEKSTAVGSKPINTTRFMEPSSERTRAESTHHTFPRSSSRMLPRCLYPRIVDPHISVHKMKSCLALELDIVKSQ